VPNNNLSRESDRYTPQRKMKTLSDQQLTALAGQYFAPTGLYQYTKSLPFLGTLTCDTKTLTAGQWTELLVEYTVGGSGLADGAWMKGTFKFYSDWALFQTTDPKQDNYVSAEYVPGPLQPGQTPATVQSLSVRFDQKGHERPFQKAIIIDVVDGYMNPGDRILVRIGDRRYGARGTRVQTFVEDAFLMRWYIDPVGTSRFAPIKPDLAFPILPGRIEKVKVVSPRLVKSGLEVPVHIHTEDVWGNTTINQDGLDVHMALIVDTSGDKLWNKAVPLSSEGWTYATVDVSLPTDGDYHLAVSVVSRQDESVIVSASEYLTADSSLPVSRPLFADLHVHSDDTVGTNDTTYNFSYARHIAGLDIVGYTANDFNITKPRWEKTLGIIKEVNAAGRFVVYPGTEWCGNSAAGGDHNVVFLDDPTQTKDIEFPFDKNGNVARSFEWNEDGPAELVPGAWPLDEVYATYAHSPEKHLLIPHVGGRRCNLAWHHPQLERLLEIGSAWGLFEWLLRDAVKRGWKLGVSANSDEHRGRCGGGVPGTAVFGTKGGLTGVLSESLDWKSVAETLRARRTFATTGERLVGIVQTEGGQYLQGDEFEMSTNKPLDLSYRFFGSEGFSSVEAWDARGRIFHRNLQEEAVSQISALSTTNKIRVKWGGARLYDRYREAIWHGSVLVSGGATISHIKPFGGVAYSPEDTVDLVSETQVTFHTRTSGDFDGVDIFFETHSSDDDEASLRPATVSVTGSVGGYVKIGGGLDTNPHKPQPNFSLVANITDMASHEKTIDIHGGAEMFVSVQRLADVKLPRRVQGQLTLAADQEKERTPGDQHQSVYFVAREWNGGKVITSPMFITYRP
jgi:hypothetical protein